MFFSIIIPTCNRNDLLKACLEQLSPVNQTISLDYEVIVTDDSKDNVAKSLIENEYPWVKWVEGSKKGPAANRNGGACRAKARWLLFIDDDCLPQKDLLKSYSLHIQNNESLVLEGKTIADREKERFDEEAPINIAGNNLWSCNFAIDKLLFLKLKGFDETFPFPAMEDVDFKTRILEVANIKFIPEAIVIHPWRRVVPFKTFNKHLKSHIHFARKHQLKGKMRFRWERLKIFLGHIFLDFKELTAFSMKGGLIYFERTVLNFCLIFI
jgi:GT2 family glycosyltransferase